MPCCAAVTQRARRASLMPLERSRPPRTRPCERRRGLVRSSAAGRCGRGRGSAATCRPLPRTSPLERRRPRPRTRQRERRRLPRPPPELLTETEKEGDEGEERVVRRRRKSGGSWEMCFYG